MNPGPLSPRPDPRRARLRFPRAARLTASGEFRRVREEGRAFHSARLVLAVRRPAAGDQAGTGLAGADATGSSLPARAGIITGRRVGRAVERVRVRRRLREILRHARPDLQPGVWLVVVAKPAARVASLAELRGDWARLAAKARILRDSSAGT